MESCPRLKVALVTIVLLAGAPALASDARFDLDVGWISRSPKIDFVQRPRDPKRDGWPAPGQVVKWTAHVKNWGSADARNVDYNFKVDGTVVQHGTANIPANGEAGVTFSWHWEFARHDLTFTIDPDNRLHELEEANNRLTVQTDAISIGFYVESSLYKYFQENQKNLMAGSNSWEDWAQRQIATYNAEFAAAISPETPAGVLDRYRIDEIRVVGDGALPLQGGSGPGFPSRMPNAADLSVDLVWGFPSSFLDGTTYRNTTFRSDRNAFYVEGSLLHELGHVRYLIDVYLFQVVHDGSAQRIEIQEDGHPVVGTNLMQLGRGGVVCSTFETGLMNQQYTRIDRYSALALNLIHGYRARGLYGNTIYNEEVGSFLHDIPESNRIRLVNTAGEPLIGASVSVYKAERGNLVPGGPFGMRYEVIYRNEPDLTAQTDANGEFVVTGDPFRKRGEEGLLTGVAILRVAQGTQVAYLYFEVTAAQRAFWRGQHREARYELVVGGSPCERAPASLTATRIPGSGSVRFAWSRVPGAYGYVVWASMNGRVAKPIGSAFSTQLETDVDGKITNWFVDAYFDQCISSRSATARTSLP